MLCSQRDGLRPEAEAGVWVRSGLERGGGFRDFGGHHVASLAGAARDPRGWSSGHGVPVHGRDRPATTEAGRPATTEDYRAGSSAARFTGLDVVGGCGFAGLLGDLGELLS
jgi:hypothetical protein